MSRDTDPFRVPPVLQWNRAHRRRLVLFGPWWMWPIVLFFWVGMGFIWILTYFLVVFVRLVFLVIAAIVLAIRRKTRPDGEGGPRARSTATPARRAVELNPSSTPAVELELHKWSQLRDSGALTEAEFAVQRARLLHRSWR
jgi:hypothetical protein